MARLLLLLALVGSLALAAACGAGGESRPSEGFSTGGVPAQPQFAPAAKGAPGALDRADVRTDPSVLPSVGDRLIIRNGQISLVVADLDAGVRAVAALAQELGGFVLSSNRAGEEAQAFAQMTLRVPSDKFDVAMERLRRLGQRAESESTGSQDVTEEFVDLQARLRVLQATEQQLIALLDRADTVEDVLKVQRELSNIRGEIERLQGRIQYLERSAAFSLITVSMRPAASPEPIVKPGWSLQETVREAARSLVESLQGVASLAVWAAVFSPLWLPPLLLLAWGAWRWRRRAGRSSGTAPRHV